MSLPELWRRATRPPRARGSKRGGCRAGPTAKRPRERGGIGIPEHEADFVSAQCGIGEERFCAGSPDVVENGGERGAGVAQTAMKRAGGDCQPARNVVETRLTVDEEIVHDGPHAFGDGGFIPHTGKERRRTLRQVGEERRVGLDEGAADNARIERELEARRPPMRWTPEERGVRPRIRRGGVRKRNARGDHLFAGEEAQERRGRRGLRLGGMAQSRETRRHRLTEHEQIAVDFHRRNGVREDEGAKAREHAECIADRLARTHGEAHDTQRVACEPWPERQSDVAARGGDRLPEPCVRLERDARVGIGELRTFESGGREQRPFGQPKGDRRIEDRARERREDRPLGHDHVRDLHRTPWPARASLWRAGSTRPSRMRARVRLMKTLPPPLAVDWPLKALSSADARVEHLDDGRMRLSLRHDVVHGVTPAMIVWWFAHIEGDARLEGELVPRYRLWHPRDHVSFRYARRAPDGGAGPGAVYRIVEAFGRNPAFLLDAHLHVQRLDEGGFVHLPRVHGLRIARADYAFERVAGGTRYVNSITVGLEGRVYRPLNDAIVRHVFPEARGRAWLLHNVEEVGCWEHFLPALYAADRDGGVARVSAAA